MAATPILTTVTLTTEDGILPYYTVINTVSTAILQCHIVYTVIVWYYMIARDHDPFEFILFFKVFILYVFFSFNFLNFYTSMAL